MQADSEFLKLVREYHSNVELLFLRKEALPTITQFVDFHKKVEREFKRLTQRQSQPGLWEDGK